ncbi:hypothetical protein G7K_6418-t1 [Saitoella complicata NRRL Y-17804]|uniref:Uncharacterized protein n=1 Tax=Saitoella complicata (strain BCRC 22490 / CBS 7301 / JCM 7358 / NBRC 10748 / NRRL Y-17804) TaxID=698492 RepID=A0A0E9NSC2_SAICN|nr:hypothetical protein G7K_6418-t1 [Saitoella complicata NRRL Y-17804]
MICLRVERLDAWELFGCEPAKPGQKRLLLCVGIRRNPLEKYFNLFSLFVHHHHMVSNHQTQDPPSYDPARIRSIARHEKISKKLKREEQRTHENPQ